MKESGRMTGGANRMECLIVKPKKPIALMMEAASTSETSVRFYQTTRRINPKDSHFHSRRREKLESHSFLLLCDRNACISHLHSALGLNVLVVLYKLVQSSVIKLIE
jgi:hypothetical protein